MKIQAALIGAILITTPLAGQTPATPTAAEPFALRGVRLGITLDEFRAIPIPTVPDSGPAEVMCTDQPYVTGTPLLSASEEEAGVLRCGWIAQGPYRRQAAEVEIANSRGSIDFDFITAPGSPPRLFRMSADFKRDEWDNIVPSFEKAYGSGQAKSDSVQNKFGATFKSGSYEWSNVVSQIQILDRCGEIDEMCIVLVHEQLSEEYIRQVDARAAAGADKL